jgi:hypothetical protein
LTETFDTPTGLPALPGSLWWHIKIVWREFDNLPCAHVSIREKRRIGYRTLDSKTLALKTLDPRDVAAAAVKEGWEVRYDRSYPYIPIPPEEYPEYIRNFSAEVLEAQSERFKHEAFLAQYEVAKKLLSGNYPPKVLEK